MTAETAMTEVLHGRHNHLIDPSLGIWGWEIPVYLFLGGLAGGLLILAAAIEIRRGKKPEARAIRFAPFSALALLSLGMLALFLDLEHKSHVWRFYASFEPTSPMSWGSWILVLVYPIGLLLGLGSLTPEEAARLARGAAVGPMRRVLSRMIALAERRRRFLLRSAIAAGASLGAYTGLLLGTLTARPLWNSTILGPLFLVSGLSTAAASLLLLRPGNEEDTLTRWDLGFIGTELLLLLFLLLDLAAGSGAQQESAGQVLGGKWTGVFWSLIVLAGLVAPMTLGILEKRRGLRPTAVAPVLVLIGGLSLRWVLLLAGQAISFGNG